MKISSSCTCNNFLKMILMPSRTVCFSLVVLLSAYCARSAPPSKALLGKPESLSSQKESGSHHHDNIKKAFHSRVIEDYDTGHSSHTTLGRPSSPSKLRRSSHERSDSKSDSEYDFDDLHDFAWDPKLNTDSHQIDPSTRHNAWSKVESPALRTPSMQQLEEFNQQRQHEEERQGAPFFSHPIVFYHPDSGQVVTIQQAPDNPDLIRIRHSG